MTDHEPTPETARLTADVALFGERDGQIYVLLIRRGWDPFADHLALPGGHVDAGEDTETAAHRELEEETGVHVRNLTYVGTYAEPRRDPRGRYVTFAYTARVGHLLKPTAGDDATEAQWIPIDALDSTKLAFDHARIIHDALDVALNP